VSRREDYSLRPLAEEDLERVLAWRNSERIRAGMYTDHVISPEEHRAWFERVRGEKRPPVMVFEHRGNPIGIVSISNRDDRNGRSYWGFYIGEAAAPRGSGTAMGFFGLEYIFETLNVRKLIGEAFSFNEASIRFHKKLGFSEEGRFAKHVLKKGLYEDVVSFALFREDWLRRKKDLEEACFGRGEAL